MNSFRQFTNRSQTRNFNTCGHRNSVSSSSSSTNTNHSSLHTAFVSLNAENLEFSHILSLKTTATQIKCEIKIGGKVIQQLDRDRMQLNLSPHLSKGKNTIEIFAQYTPSSSELQVEFVGLDTQVVQQIKGDDVLQYKLIVMVI